MCWPDVKLPQQTSESISRPTDTEKHPPLTHIPISGQHSFKKHQTLHASPPVSSEQLKCYIYTTHSSLGRLQPRNNALELHLPPQLLLSQHPDSHTLSQQGWLLGIGELLSKHVPCELLLLLTTAPSGWAAVIVVYMWGVWMDFFSFLFPADLFQH